MAKKFKCELCGQTFEAESMPDKCPICGAPSSAIVEIVETADGQVQKKGLNTNSNVYTMVYAAVMVILVAFLLAFVSSALKPAQDVNVENDTKSQILSALGYDKETVDVKATFEEKVQDKLFQNGELIPYEGKFLSSYGSAIKKGELHVFVAKAADGQTAYVIPVTGRGLWGGLWGYIALDETKTKVLGTYFYHESETAGLGARIAEKEFQDLFIGRPVYDEGKIALTVVKSGAAVKDYEVNGITGATLTSNGVGAMCTEGLGAYAEFLKLGTSVASEESASVEVVESADSVQVDSIN